jgi:hypothetical protein
VTVTDVEGSEPPEHFGFGDRLEIITAESRRMSEVVEGLDLEARVPTTPEWSVRDLAHHIGVEQWCRPTAPAVCGSGHQAQHGASGPT